MGKRTTVLWETPTTVLREEGKPFSCVDGKRKERKGKRRTEEKKRKRGAKDTRLICGSE